MKKLRDRLNKKGFTLVELIVVIVIILILAAALVPNVMRYIGQAKESAFQADASSYLVESQGICAEYYAKKDKDLVCISTNNAEYAAPYKLSNLTAAQVVINSAAVTDYSSTAPKTTVGKKVEVQVNKGAVLEFTYTDGKYYVTWKQASGWTDVAKNEKPGP